MLEDHTTFDVTITAPMPVVGRAHEIPFGQPAGTLWCAVVDCGRQIVSYGFADLATPPTGPLGPFVCLWHARDIAAAGRAADIVQAFTTVPIKPGSVWGPLA